MKNLIDTSSLATASIASEFNSISGPTRISVRVIILIAVLLLSTGCAPNQEATPPETKGNSRPSESLTTEEATSIKENDRNRAILNSIVDFVLTDAHLADSREFYGTAGEKTIALVSSHEYGVPWPEWFTPANEEFAAIRTSEEIQPEANAPRILGIRIDAYDVEEVLDSDAIRILSGQISIMMLNAGGDDGSSIHTGGKLIYFDSIQTDGKWRVKSNGSIDP